MIKSFFPELKSNQKNEQKKPAAAPAKTGAAVRSVPGSQDRKPRTKAQSLEAPLTLAIAGYISYLVGIIHYQLQLLRRSFNE